MKKSSSAIPERLRPFLRIGTCSWKYDSWKGLIYDAGKSYRPDDYLGDYARRLNSVEVDQWFWSLFPGSIRLPEPRVVRRYAESVPDDFVFTVKAPNALTLTHFYAKKEAGTGEFAGKPNGMFLNIGLLEKFLDRLSPLDKKLGPIMFQFEYLNRQKMASQEDFLGRCAAFVEAAPRTLALAIEPRNPRWLDERYFGFLADHGLSHVFLQGYYMPPMEETYKRHARMLRGAVVVRLHGPDREGMEKATGESWDRIVAPKDEELRRVVEMINDMRGRSLTVYLNVNNHYEGSAPLTIARLKEMGLAEGP